MRWSRGYDALKKGNGKIVHKAKRKDDEIVWNKEEQGIFHMPAREK